MDSSVPTRPPSRSELSHEDPGQGRKNGNGEQDTFRLLRRSDSQSLSGHVSPDVAGRPPHMNRRRLGAGGPGLHPSIKRKV